MPHKTPKPAGQKTFENAVHTFYLMWCYRDFYGGAEAGCTVIQRAKHVVVLKACCSEFIKTTEEVMVLKLKLQTCEKKVIFLEN